ncbi:MAG: hypothetical protein ABSA65_14895 [Acidimicrobiales bacterium]|jgi:hypothetical protein
MTGGAGPRAKGASDLDRLRGQRDALHTLERLRDLLALYDRGEIGLDELGYGIGLLGARLGAAACRGELAS